MACLLYLHWTISISYYLVLNASSSHLRGAGKNCDISPWGSVRLCNVSIGGGQCVDARGWLQCHLGWHGQLWMYFPVAVLPFCSTLHILFSVLLLGTWKSRFTLVLLGDLANCVWRKFPRLKEDKKFPKHESCEFLILNEKHWCPRTVGNRKMGSKGTSRWVPPAGNRRVWKQWLKSRGWVSDGGDLF